MNKMILSLFVLLGATANAHYEAEVLNCVITEPFINYEFNPEAGTLTMTSMDISPAVAVVSRDAKMVSVTAADLDGTIGSQYQITDTVTNEVYIELTLDGQGTDGMSDNSYPFSAKIGDYYGGCSSTSAPSYNLFEAVSKLQGEEY